MRWKDGFIAVDWGTTNRRAYRLDAGGRCLASFEDSRGILSVEREEFPAAAAEIRERLGDLPMLLAGMVGSTRGWAEAPYVPCPTSLGAQAGALRWVEEGMIAIVPGVSVIDSGRPDVMRGEEVQLFGAVAADLIPKDCFVGHPGTHNKWVVLSDGQILTFRTVMTGELFGMLRETGMLADILVGDVSLGEAFNNGVSRGLAGAALTAELFSVRAGSLLGTLAPEAAASFVSGLLIGADIAVGIGLATAEEPIIFMGDPQLTRFYLLAATLAGRDAQEVDGEAAFLAGAAALAGMIQ